MKEEYVSVVEYRLDGRGEERRRLLWGGLTEVARVGVLCRALCARGCAGRRVVCARRERWSLDEWACLYEGVDPVREQTGSVDLEGLLEDLWRRSVSGGRLARALGRRP